jgi:hypothetical protein
VNSRSGLGLSILLALSTACGDGSGPDGPEEPEPWQVVHESLPGALLSVWGTSASDVWTVGADAGDGRGPLVLHLYAEEDGEGWSRLETGQSGDLWWVHGFAGGPRFMGGAGGLILRHDESGFTRMETPGTGVVFGLWGSSPDQMWAVGGEAGGSQGAFAWRLEGERWVEAPGFPSDLAATAALWKVYGRGASNVWLVGTGGNLLHWDGSQLTRAFAGRNESLFTVHGNSERFVAVGGFGTGLLLEQSVGASVGDAWVDVAPAGAPSIIGVCATETGGHAVGEFGYVAERGPEGWVREETGLDAVIGVRNLHSVWVDPSGGVWAAGGEVRVPPLVNGILVHRGEAVPSGDGLL